MGLIERTTYPNKIKRVLFKQIQEAKNIISPKQYSLFYLRIISVFSFFFFVIHVIVILCFSNLPIVTNCIFLCNFFMTIILGKEELDCNQKIINEKYSDFSFFFFFSYISSSHYQNSAFLSSC